MKKITLALVAAASFVLLSLPCQAGSKDTKIVKFNLRSDAKTLDPQLETDESASKIDSMCMEGLVGLGKAPGEVRPAAAESWDVSQDGKTWTFHLRKNLKWSNGDPLTANDFLYAFKRVLEPATAAQYANLLYYLKNAQEYNTGKITDFSQVGVSVVDDNTLKIILDKPVPYFSQILAYATCYPLNQKFYESVKDGYCLSADSMLYNGPWVISEMMPDGKYLFKKNENYWNKDNIKIDTIEFYMVDQYNTAANMYKNGELDMCIISGDQLAKFKNDPDMHDYMDGAVWYLEFNTSNKFFKNQKIREAVSLAINRDVLCNNIRKDGSLPARAFVPPGMTGGDKEFREKFTKEYFKDDVQKAKQLLAEGLKEIGHTGTVDIRILTDQSDVAKRDSEFLQQELFKNLGINVTIEQNTFQGRLQKMDQKDFEIVMAGWHPDYNDPMTFLDMWMTGNGNNHTSWSNPEYDKMLEDTNKSPDNTYRMETMAKAEKMLMTELPITPLYYSIRHWIIRPWLKDMVIRTSGIDVSFYWAYIKE